jgi:farnesyl-diphosphate farnesyltransferase
LVSLHSSWYVSIIYLIHQMLTASQLFVAWMAGARFDIAYYKAKEQIGELMGWGASNATKIAEVTKVVEAVPVHSEL